MNVVVGSGVFSGVVRVPASKSHTIRRLLMASFTGGLSRIEDPLDSLDARSCVHACRVLGALVDEERDRSGDIACWLVRGTPPASLSESAVRCIDVGNSGTTLFLFLAAAALGSFPVTFTGDEQIAKRSAGPLLDALLGLGVTVDSSGGCTPITICGPWKSGRVNISCPTSQYLSALLLAAPLAPAGTLTELEVPLLNEKPYVEMTLSYLAAQGLYRPGMSCNDSSAPMIKAPVTAAPIMAAADFSFFRIRGGAVYRVMNGPVPGDFSSAAFPAAAAVISGGTVTLTGLDPADTQGDKVFFDYLLQMGCTVVGGDDGITVSRQGPLRGGIFDLNATPDLLPVMAALGAFAGGETVLVNAAHARIKETDRIAVMAAELRKLFAGTGFRCTEKPDGMILHPAVWNKDCQPENGGSIIKLDGHGDHRVVMALACAALGLPAGTRAEISGAEAADVTYPGFLKLLV